MHIYMYLIAHTHTLTSDAHKWLFAFYPSSPGCGSAGTCPEYSTTSFSSSTTKPGYGRPGRHTHHRVPGIAAACQATLLCIRSALMLGLKFSSPSSFRLGSPNCQVLQAAKLPNQKKGHVSCTWDLLGVLELFIEGFQHHLHLVYRR